MTIYEPFNFQENAVNKLVYTVKELLTEGHTSTPNSNGLTARSIVFKSPTGSGKTIMMGSFFKRLIEEEKEGWNPQTEYVFVWVSLNDLHTQSMKKINKIVGNSYNVKTLDELNSEPFTKNTILFANWQSLKTKKTNDLGIQEWANRSVKKTEKGSDLGTIIDKTKDKVGKNVEVIVIVDESHNHLTKQSYEFIKEILNPIMLIQISATPAYIPNKEETDDTKTWGYVSVPFKEVVESGLIKKKTVVNVDLDEYNSPVLTDLEIMLEAAYQKRLKLKEKYEQEGTNINPLILVQLPSGDKKISELDTTTKEAVEKFFATKDITRENGKLAAWLADDKENKENIEQNDNEVEVLIFKVAIAQGTDIPRGSILVMLRDIGSITLEIQTVGRVLRMPEAKHYVDDELNTAYLYTNIDSIDGVKDQEALEFFSLDVAHLKSSIENIYLPTTIQQRIDSVQLDSRFEIILFKKMLNHFHITYSEVNGIPRVSEDKETIYEKIDNNAESEQDNGLDIYINELQKISKVGIEITNMDEVEKYIGQPPRTQISMNSASPLVREQYYYICRAWISPYLSGRGINKLHNVLRRFFSMAGINEDYMQRIIALSKHNQRVIGELVQLAKEEFVTMDVKETGGLKRSFGDVFFSLDKTVNVPKSYEKTEGYNKYVYEPCFMPKVNGKSYKTEEGFEKDILETRNDILWWYKNPSTGNSLGIKYSYMKPRNEEDGLFGGYTEAIFRPDYIVMFTDGTLGIYDTKSFGTKDSAETEGKANALAEYIKMLNSKCVKADGGIVDAGTSSYRVFRGDIYSSVPTNTGWTDWDARSSTIPEDCVNALNTLEAFENDMRKNKEQGLF